ncbi:MAG: GAF domain-containing sensor histidine kinase [Anaerolineae bacterium]|nr:GAF domain-containing sensor histidine kinase [Anaerolineae bacterium]
MGQIPSAPTWRDWYVFGIRWVIIGGFVLLLMTARNITNLPADLNNALLVAAAANCLLALTLLLPFKSASTAVTLITDWVILGALAWVSTEFPLIVTGLAAIMILVSLLQANATYSLFHALGSLILAAAGLLNVGRQIDVTDYVFGPARLPLLEIALVGIVVVISAYLLEKMIWHQKRTFKALEAARSAQIVDIHERTRAIYEMTTTFRETLSFERILNAALDAGQLGLSGHTRRALVAGVLLFQAEDPGLCVVAARRMTRGDMNVIAPGTSGIIGEALAEGVPIIGGHARKDPELQRFVGFQSARSTLCVPLRAGYDNFGVLLYGADISYAFTNEHIELLAAIGVQATIALQNYVLYQSLLEEKNRIARVADDERKQLARQLHDGPTQKISAIAMMASIMHKMLERTPERVPEELSKMEEIARTTTREMRHMLFTLRPLVLESQGLTAALNQLAEKMRETHGQKVSVYMQPGVEQLLDSSKQGIIFYLVEEGLNNARKHAQASLISVDIVKQGSDLKVTISDNGAGFDTGKVSQNYENRGSLGMVNMHERAAMLNGSLQIASTPGSGTTITLIAPLFAESRPKLKLNDDTIIEIPLERLKLGNIQGSGTAFRSQSNGSFIRQ